MALQRRACVAGYAERRLFGEDGLLAQRERVEVSRQEEGHEGRPGRTCREKADSVPRRAIQASHRPENGRAEGVAPREGEQELRRRILLDLFGRGGDSVWMQPPFYCDYGTNILLGQRVFFNFNCVVLDCAAVTIGANVLLGPAVQIYAATHPTDPSMRRSGRELALPVAIGDDVWIGGGAIICPGVTIGSSSTIGAGSVVTRDIPAGVIAAGNPCRVIRGCAEAEE